jgi:DamX protein
LVSNPEPSQTYSIGWLRTRPAGGYVLQLFGVRDRAAAVKFIKDRKIDGKSGILGTDHEGAPWFVVIYGYYPDRASAQAAIPDLPPKLTATPPWARPIASLN